MKRGIVCSKNEELCIKNEELCTKDDEFCRCKLQRHDVQLLLQREQIATMRQFPVAKTVGTGHKAVVQYKQYIRRSDVHDMVTVF